MASEYLINRIDESKVNIVAYIDSYREGHLFNGKPLIKPEEIPDYTYDYVVLGSSCKFSEIKEILLKYVPDEKIISFMFKEEELSEIINRETNMLIREKLNDYKISEISEKIKPKKFYNVTMWFRDENPAVTSKDYVREQTMALLGEEIYRKKVQGNVAELGVYQGEFSWKINKVFYDRTLYLFDTFEGFDKKDIEKDENINQEYAVIHLKDTSVQKVLEKLPNPEKCIIKKGYFPDTFDLDSDEKFAFVNIDVDLYTPILEGIKTFYPRLSKGGYIMIHDYNNDFFEGAKQAVIEYCDANNISYVPIPDLLGSVVITK